MNYYFFLKTPDPNLKGEITLANFAPVNAVGANSMPMHVHSAFIDQGSWMINKIATLNPGAAITLKEDDMDHIPHWAAPLFFLYPDLLPQKLQRLPLSDAMSTEPSWRGNIRIRSPYTCASYQGEYPDKMLKLHHSSAVSFNPMNQNSDTIKTTLFAVNFLETPQVRTVKLKAALVRTRRQIHEFEIVSNSTNPIDLGPLQGIKEPTYFYSNEIAMIPIYFSCTNDLKKMDLEHTHPPHDLILFGNKKQEVVKEMKSWWGDIR